MFKKIIGGLFVLALVGCASQISFTEPYQSAVQIKLAERDHCSGSIIADNAESLTILTAGHCVLISDTTVLSVETASCGIMNAFAAEGLRDETDVGLLHVKKIKACEATVATLGNEAITGEPVVVVGFPAPFDKSVSFGYVALPYAYEQSLRMTVFQLAGAPGSSGSGIYNSDGELISVLTGPLPGMGLIRGSTIDDIKAFISKAVQ